MIEVLLLVPIRDNEGERFPHALRIELEDRLVALAGGVTTRGRAAGVWRDDSGRRYRDASIEYEVDLSSWVQLPTFLDEVRWIRGAFRQLALWVKIAGIPEILVD